MQQGHPKSEDDPVFDAVITPHRSLSGRGLFWLMAFFVFVTTAISIPFYLMGAWPVVGFLGLDLLLIYAAFRYHNATARAYERIVLSRIELMFRSVSWRGAVKERRFNPVWVRLERQEHPEFGTEKLELVQGKQRVEIASQLGREERGDFARHFQNALTSAKRG